MNLGVLAADVASEIGMSSTTGTAERSLIDYWLNEAVVDFLTKTKCYVKRFGMNMAAGVGDYDLPSLILSMKSLAVLPDGGQTVTFLEPVSGRDLLIKRLAATSAVGAGPPGYYALEGWNLLMVYPVAASANDVLMGTYVPRPVTMSADAHDPATPTYGGIPAEYHPALANYGKYKAASYDDDSSSRAAAARRGTVGTPGSGYLAEYDQQITRVKGELLRKAGVRLAPARPGGRKKYYPPPGVDALR